MADQSLATETSYWNVTSLLGKEPELAHVVERYQVDIVGLTSTHGLGFGINLLERDWTLCHAGMGWVS